MYRKRRRYGYGAHRRRVRRFINSAWHRKKFPWFPRKRRQPGRIPHLPYKRLEYATGSAAIQQTALDIPINNIPQGTDVDGERSEQKVRLHNWNYNGIIAWDTGTPGSYILRLVVCSCKSTFTGTGITLSANIYDKRDFPDIGHVYKDFRIVRGKTDEMYRKLRVGIRRFHRAVLYDGDAATDYSDNGYNKISMFVVGDIAAGTTSIGTVYSVLHYQG